MLDCEAVADALRDPDADPRLDAERVRCLPGAPGAGAVVLVGVVAGDRGRASRRGRDAPRAGERPPPESEPVDTARYAETDSEESMPSIRTNA
jgi:hypothetical protein